LATPSDNLWIQLGSASLYTGLVPIALGSVLAILKTWIASEDSMRSRVTLREQGLREAVNKALHNLLTKAVLDLDPKKLRIASLAEPDVVDDYTKEVFRVFNVDKELQQIMSSTRRINTALYVTFAASLSGYLAVLLFDWLRPVVVVIWYTAVASQLVMIGLFRRYMRQLEIYETTT
jgi:hypothetical protein